jgi:hypothetical protein
MALVVDARGMRGNKAVMQRMLIDRDRSGGLGIQQSHDPVIDRAGDRRRSAICPA